MPIEIKVQIILASILSLELLGLFMIIIRTTANLEHGLNRVEEIINREIQLSLRIKDKERITKEKAAQADQGSRHRSRRKARYFGDRDGENYHSSRTEFGLGNSYPDSGRGGGKTDSTIICRFIVSFAKR